MDQESKVFIKTEKPVEQVVKKDSSISIKKSRMFTKKLKTLMINKKKKRFQAARWFKELTSHTFKSHHLSNEQEDNKFESCSSMTL